MATGVQHGAATQCPGRPVPGAGGHQPNAPERIDHEPSSLIRAGTTTGGRSLPAHLRSDNGPEFTAKAIRKWLDNLKVGPLFIEPGSPWENGYNESFNGKLRDELLNGEIFYTLAEARIIIERWRVHYNTKRPHTSLGYRPPAPEAIILPKMNVRK